MGRAMPTKRTAPAMKNLSPRGNTLSASKMVSAGNSSIKSFYMINKQVAQSLLSPGTSASREVMPRVIARAKLDGTVSVCR